MKAYVLKDRSRSTRASIVASLRSVTAKIMFAGELGGRCRGVKTLRERKVRTPQGSVPDNVRDSGFKAGRRPVPQKIYRQPRKRRVRVKRCGKSAPPRL